MLLATLDHETAIGKTFNLIGGETPVEEAVRSL